MSQGVYDKNAPVDVAHIEPAVLDIFAGGTAQPEAIACIGTFAVCTLSSRHTHAFPIPF